jgi:hypothetical protein
MLSPSKAGQTKNYSHSKLVLKQNNISPTSIQSSAHLQSLPGMVHFPEMNSDNDEDDDDEEEEEDEDDEDDVIITYGLQHSLKMRNYASASSYPNATHDYENNNDDASSSSDHSTIGDSSGGVSNDDYEDNYDDAKDANHEANNDDATDGNESSICDGTHSKEDYSNEEDHDYSFAYASSSPCTAMSNNHNAVGSTSNAINDSNNCIAVGGRDDDIMSLSCTNQSLQPNLSASESSSFIGPHCNPKWNARLKVKRYNIGEDSSDGENECSSSDERVSSVGGSS